MSGSFLLTFLFFTCFLCSRLGVCFLRVFYVFFIAVFYEFFITRFLSLVFYSAYANFLNNFRFLLVFPGFSWFLQVLQVSPGVPGSKTI